MIAIQIPKTGHYSLLRTYSATGTWTRGIGGHKECRQHYLMSSAIVLTILLSGLDVVLRSYPMQV